MEKGKLSNIIKYAGAIVALLIGSGFATGQEVLQYFTSYGWQGMLVVIAMFIMMTYVMVEFMMTGNKEKFESGNDIYYYYAGPYLGKFYDYFSAFFLFLSFIVMVAGAGATANQHFGIPKEVGGIILGLLAIIACITGLRKIVDIIGGIGPVIVIIAILLGIITALRNPEGLAHAEGNLALVQDKVLKVSSNWYTSALSYVGFCMLWLAAFVSQMGKEAESKKDALYGAILGSFAFSLAVLVVYLGLLSAITKVAGSQIPNLILAGEIAPWLPTVFSIMIFAGIFTTAVPLLWSVIVRFKKEGSREFKLLTIILGLIGIAIGVLIKFDRLINIIYGLNGYIGIALIILMIIKSLRRMANK